MAIYGFDQWKFSSAKSVRSVATSQRNSLLERSKESDKEKNGEIYILGNRKRQACNQASWRWKLMIASKSQFQVVEG